ncbi:MAG: CocE/NonD family hydrolase [Candidatus Eremiobacteraeota bacterium]|nr:CocE/NonD family hydrolase [Candidatus Eremiobacteraeota bacterium]
MKNCVNTVKYALPLIVLAIILSGASPSYPEEKLCDFSIEKEKMVMKDGTGIAMTYYLPRAAGPGERFPVVFELLPYRKDDIFAMRDFSLYAYFARRGIVMAKADVRGTGSSDGAIPEKEYSDQELDDAVELIDRLSKKPWSNGRVGMWGISWSGFNAIQVAMRRPPALKAILAADASDDLYHDDVHYIDGIFHIDEYELSIENDLILPRSPLYPVDEDYFRDRFERYPWFLTYKKNQTDGPFWRRNSLRWQYQKLAVPAFLIGGLADGYRDSIPRMLTHCTVPMRALLGPWNHAWPDDGVPGPVIEWRDEAVQWWKSLLGEGKELASPLSPLAVYVRHGDPPDEKLESAKGSWVAERYPLSEVRWKRLYLNGSHTLRAAPEKKMVHRLSYRPGAGTACGYWWGEATGDMSRDDGAALVYDSEVLAKDIEIIGIPQAHLRVSSSAKLAHWVVRLEDIFPDGRVALVTGAVQNGSQIKSRVSPGYLERDKTYDINLPLHFTTWTFRPGHRIRVAVTNAQFPMIWPTPYPMTTCLVMGSGATSIDLPVTSGNAHKGLSFKSPQPREEMPFSKYLPAKWPKSHKVIDNLETSEIAIEFEGERALEHEGNTYSTLVKTIYSTNERNPADSSFHGEAESDVKLLTGNRRLSVSTFIDVSSDERSFLITFTRRISENGELKREKTWKESIPRMFQ